MKPPRQRVSKRATKPKDCPMPTSPGAAVKNLSRLCLDPGKPPEVRAKILLDVLHNTYEEPHVQQALLTDLLRQTGGRAPEAELAHLRESYELALAELAHGAVRPATYLGVVDGDLPGPGPRAHVVTPDGQERCPTLHPRLRLADLRRGVTVYLDPKGAVVLGLGGVPARVGQQGTFLRRVEGTTQVEANVQNERLLLHAPAAVLDAAAAGRLKPGDRLLVCPRRLLALGLVPPDAECRHRFLDRARVPDVVAERDIGKPHPVLGHLLGRLRVLLYRPDLLARFDLRPRFAALLTGPTGCGKTLTIRAFLREFDRLLVERTGRHDLGSRVIRVRVAELLSEWLGRSDKNVEELFDDIQTVAGTPVETAAGESLWLPVVVVLEEVEGLARRRGGPDSAAYDRILATLLQRLEGPCDEFGRLPLVLISTSNRPDLIDSAMLRRLGLRARFTRLDRDGLTAVLDKKLKPDYPYEAEDGQTPEEARAEVLARVTGWLFGPGPGGAAVVELTLDDGRELLKRRRDFLTGGVVEQAVAAAIDETVARAEETDAAAVGLTALALIDALRRHIDGLADNLTAENAADYLDLPEHTHVVSLRRLQGSAGQMPFLLNDSEN